MKNILRTGIFYTIIFIGICVSSSCQRRAASCPAYRSVDPSKSNINQSFEKFVNADVKPKTAASNKKDVEKRKNAELNKVHNRKKSYNLFPAYMR